MYKQRAEKISGQLDEIKRKIEDAENSKKLLEQNELSDKIKLKDFLEIQKFIILDAMNATGQVKEFIMPNTDKTAVEIEWVLDTPVREDIYEYIVNG
ncbi:DUF3427 domain-containing protein [Coprococcus comes]|uniref:DUF3427 domain-containing protein n=1 Tax=Coprococcus comes TaxID=410072 RepID=UPI003F8ACEED